MASVGDRHADAISRELDVPQADWISEMRDNRGEVEWLGTRRRCPDRSGDAEPRFFLVVGGLAAGHDEERRNLGFGFRFIVGLRAAREAESPFLSYFRPGGFVIGDWRDGY